MIATRSQIRNACLIVWCIIFPLVPLNAGENVSPFFQALNQGANQTVVFYGTSLTHSGSWTRAAREWFEANYPGQVTAVNSGGPGQTSEWGVNNLKEKVLAHHPNLVFVEFSYNDAHTKFQMPVERGYQNLDTIVSGIRKQNPDCVIVLQTMNPAWDAPGKTSATDRPQLEAFNENYRRYARERPLPLMDHYLTWKELQKAEPEKFKSYLPDGSHPNAEAGQKVIWPTLQRWLEAQASQAKSTAG